MGQPSWCWCRVPNKLCVDHGKLFFQGQQWDKKANQEVWGHFWLRLTILEPG